MGLGAWLGITGITGASRAIPSAPRQHVPPNGGPLAGRPEAANGTPSEDGVADPTRRRFVTRAGKTVAVAAPLILLFHPSAAYAGSGNSPTS